MLIRLLKTKPLHFIILALMIVYVLLANTIYVNFILRNGKPVAVNPSLPAENNTFEHDFGRIQPVRYDGQNYQMLPGYALHNTILPTDYSIQVVLHSTSTDLLYDVDRAAVPDLIKRRKDYRGRMRPAEFHLMFSENVLAPDNYRIGILLKDPQGSVVGFKWTNSYIERTPNKVRFILGH